MLKSGCTCYRSYYVAGIFFAIAVLKETRQSIIFQLRFPKRLGKALIEALLREEQEELQAFVKTRRSETKWAEEFERARGFKEFKGLRSSRQAL